MQGTFRFSNFIALILRNVSSLFSFQEPLRKLPVCSNQITFAKCWKIHISNGLNPDVDYKGRAPPVRDREALKTPIMSHTEAMPRFEIQQFFGKIFLCVLLYKVQKKILWFLARNFKRNWIYIISSGATEIKVKIHFDEILKSYPSLYKRFLFCSTRISKVCIARLSNFEHLYDFSAIQNHQLVHFKWRHYGKN